MDFRIEEVNVAGRNQIRNIEPASNQELIQIPGATREDAGGLGANPSLQFAYLKRLEDSQVDIEGDRFITQSKSQIAY